MMPTRGARWPHFLPYRHNGHGALFLRAFELHNKVCSATAARDLEFFLVRHVYGTLGLRRLRLLDLCGRLAPCAPRVASGGVARYREAPPVMRVYENAPDSTEFCLHLKRDNDH